MTKNNFIDERYSRNRLYITKEEQTLLAQCKLVLGGSGLGSIIAECALRIGIENICIIDGDTVELSNLNRQNYTKKDVGKYKTEVLYNRLKEINPNAQITYVTEFLTENNISTYLSGASVAVNALDFTSNVPFCFDKFCVAHNITVLHPYNLGWAAFVTVVNSEQSLLSQLGEEYNFELKMGEYIVDNLRKEGIETLWLNRIIETLKKEGGNISQLSVASWITAGLCTRVLFKIATRQDTKIFPEYYYLSTL